MKRMTPDPFCMTSILSGGCCRVVVHTKTMVAWVRVADGVFKHNFLQTMMTQIIPSTLYKTFQGMYLVLNPPV